MTLQIITANRLADGKVVFLAEGGRWVEQFQGGRIAADEANAVLLQLEADQAVVRAEVVGPYLIEVGEQDGRLQPSRYRERIRVEGPSVGGQSHNRSGSR